ncbi:hypothetical protein [Thermaerobacter subterraneus]|uniref:Uncharacterized protein n=1 Tax=Thermaerobacter subterraneus DSM 13965 TaxID=867903 RepID=K6P072_9FIRM|nr:hypothetical protein [Thermaerobacter subterraneus]EKP94480.1 hypothetical protein ThesuDRAFT_02217 [Thermaerobacter subterraneus DSM 13965]
MPIRDILEALANLPDPISRAEHLLRHLPFLRDYVESVVERVARLSKGRAPWEGPAGRRSVYGDPTFAAVATLEEHEPYQFARAVVRFVDRLPEGVRQIVDDLYVHRTRTRADLTPDELKRLYAVLQDIWDLIGHAAPVPVESERVAS